MKDRWYRGLVSCANSSANRGDRGGQSRHSDGFHWMQYPDSEWTRSVRIVFDECLRVTVEIITITELRRFDHAGRSDALAGQVHI